MRSVNRTVAAAAVAALAAGCGTYSTEDLRFLAALPQREDLRVTVPAGGTSAAGALTTTSGLSALTACAPPGSADVWLRAKDTSDGLNAGVDFVIGLIDAVRKHPPTARDDDYRRWGPFVPDDRPGREVQIVITRSFPPELGGRPRYGYTFEGRWKDAGGPFLPIVQGAFDGASATHGKGWVELRFDDIRLLSMHDASSPDGVMSVQYDRASDPRTTDLTLATSGFGVPQFGYGFAGYANGTGAFDYRLVNALSGDKLTVKASWDAAKAGRLSVFYEQAPPSTLTGTFDQCWDANGCLVYVNDPNDLSCPVGPCSTPPSTLASCVTVPVAPF
jgi:hypothetical protein